MEWFLLVAVLVVLAAWFASPGRPDVPTDSRAQPNASSRSNSSRQIVRGARVHRVAVPAERSISSDRPAEESGGGILRYHGLLEWWRTEFTQDERQYIDQAFQPMGFSNRGLEHGDIHHSSQSPVSFLSSLAGWFGKQHERPLAYRILAKAEEIVDEATPVLDRHFMYGKMVKLYYKDRSDQEKLAKAIDACRKQIAMGYEAVAAFKAKDSSDYVPSHAGYQQLVIVLEKNGNLQEAIDLCR